MPAGIGDWNTAKSVGREVCGVPGEVGSGKGGSTVDPLQH